MKGQVTREELDQQVEKFKNGAFTKCGNGAQAPVGGIEGDLYYSGPFDVDASIVPDGLLPGAHHGQMVVESQTTKSLRSFVPLPDSTVAPPNQWKGSIVLNSSESRERFRYDGKDWGKWEASKTLHPPVVVALLLKRNGRWFASDARLTGYRNSLVASLPGNFDSNTIMMMFNTLLAGTKELQALLGPWPTLDDLLKTINPPSCDDLFPQRPVAPGHSITDTYVRTMQIARENASKGVHDNVCWEGPDNVPHSNCPSVNFVGLPVCYSFDKSGICVPTGERVHVPGDVVFVDAVDWETFGRPGACRSLPQSIEVSLKDATKDDGRKRFINCVTAGMLAAVRKRLIDRGAEPEIQARPAPEGAQRISGSSASIHSLTDTYARTVEIINENARKGIPDRVQQGNFQNAHVCYSISATGQCQQDTGEIVNTPGDLAEPLDWAAVSRLGYCGPNRLGVGEAVVLKNPVPNDGKKRFLRCIDASRLAQFYNDLVQLGVK